MHRSMVWCACLAAHASCATELVEEPVSAVARGGGEEGMNCMGAGFSTWIYGPAGTSIEVPTRDAVGLFADQLAMDMTRDPESGGAVFGVFAPSFHPVLHGTWFEKLYQIVLPPSDEMGGLGPFGDLVRGHYDLGGFADVCLDEGAVSLGAARQMIKVFLYALIQDSACPPPQDIEGTFAAVEVVMLRPGWTYSLPALIEQNVVRAVPDGEEPTSLCLLWKPKSDAASLFAVADMKPPCAYELGLLEAVVRVEWMPTVVPTSGAPVSFAGPDDLGALAGVRDFLRSPTEAVGDVTAVSAEVHCTNGASLCPLELQEVTIGSFSATYRGGEVPLVTTIGASDAAAAVLLPFDAQVACLSECPPTMPGLDAYTCGAGEGEGEGGGGGGGGEGELGGGHLPPPVFP